jgi:protein-S-isoprenylcysteine O-methyltransferase Ste14
MPFPIKDWILRKLTTYRGFAYLPPFILMAITFYHETEHHLIIWPLGITLILIGGAIRLWATKHIGRRMPWVKKKGKQLVRTGPYAMVRNPLYIGNIIAATGLSLFSELMWFTPIVTLYLFILYHLVALFEEKKLTERWGEDYQLYMEEVPRWIPQINNWPATKEGGLRWMDAFRSEIPSFYVTLLGILIFVLKEYLSHMD